MPDFLHHFESALAALKNERRYRVFADLERQAGRFPNASWRGTGRNARRGGLVLERLSRHGPAPDGDRAMHAALDACGAGAGGTRNISGTNHYHRRCWKPRLADLHGKEAALVFTSGYISNLAGIATLARLLPDCLILSDAFNHASMIEGVRHAGSEKRDLAPQRRRASGRLLIRADTRDRPKLIVFESVYSMDGDVAPIAKDLRLGRAL